MTVPTAPVIVAHAVLPTENTAIAPVALLGEVVTAETRPLGHVHEKRGVHLAVVRLQQLS